MPADSQTFNLLNQNIEQGTYLIEASAGTGKTYNIQHLYLRLLLEREDIDNVGNILVVTFTELATAELKNRIRKNLAVACDYLEKNLLLEGIDFKNFSFPTIDRTIETAKLSLDGTLLKILLQATKGQEKIIKRLLQRLRLALNSFDQSAIFTIHGLCYRLLNENFFEADTLFNTELIMDQDNLILEVVQDFWRKHFYHLSPIHMAVANHFGLNLEALTRLAENLAKNPDLKPLPMQADGKDHLLSTWDKIREKWAQNRQQILECLKSKDNKIARGKEAYKQENLDRDAQCFDKMTKQDPAVGIICRYAKSVLDQSVTPKQKEKGVKALAHPFFDLCEEFYRMAGQFVLQKKLDLLRYIVQDKALEDRKAAYNVQSFDDLLLKVRQALRDKSGLPNKNSGLARQIRNRFKVALIDEFQDIDPVQYEIFQTVFDKPGHLLFMIGDPKQSIYAFRGADIYAYLNVSKQSHIQKKTLEYNYRSSEEMIQAVNAFFGSHPNPFLFQDIRYDCLGLGRPPDYDLVLEEANSRAPMQFGWLSSNGQKPLVKREAYIKIYFYVAQKIAQILDQAQKGQAFFRDRNKMTNWRPVRPEDIAVLVFTNQQASEMQKYLREKKVPSILQNTGNLFQTREAEDVFRVLRAVLTPHNKKYLFTALVTSLFDLDAITIAAYNEQESFQDECNLWVELLSEYRRIWYNQGFIQMFQMLMKPESYSYQKGGLLDRDTNLSRLQKQNPKLKKDLAENLLGQPQGERRLTNVRHLMEILHQKSRSQNLSPEGLLRWLAKQINEPEFREEHELRLEKDSYAVKILTIHKSKGLEFPIVFCPFLWTKGFKKSTKEKNEPYTFHLPRESGRTEVRLALTQEIRDQYEPFREKEDLAEALRLVYVALTRARDKIYLFWGDIQETEDTALMYLRKEIGRLNQSFSDYLASLDKKEISKQVDCQSEDQDQLISPICWESSLYIDRFQLEEFQAENYRADLEEVFLSSDAWPQGFSVPHDWGLMSFSSLVDQLQTTGHPKESILEEFEWPGGQDQPWVEESSFVDFPRGRATGDAIHEILESLHFSDIQGQDPTAWPNTDNTIELIKSKIDLYNCFQLPEDPELTEKVKQTGCNQVCDMLGKLMTTAFQSCHGEKIRLNHPGLSLIKEMRFYLQIDRQIDLTRLNDLLYTLGVQKIDNHEQMEAMLKPLVLSIKNLRGPKRGCILGSIDLVFKFRDRYFLADWKTNSLGDRLADYSPFRIRQDMATHGYLLQYLIYTAALNRLLKIRLKDRYNYESHFGGGFYFYLRGLNGLDDQTGVFFQRLSQDQIFELEAALGIEG